MLTPGAIGESLWPKHTGQASAARGAASMIVESRTLRIGYRFLVLRWNIAA
jgi:hypothetical protein